MINMNLFYFTIVPVICQDLWCTLSGLYKHLRHLLPCQSYFVLFCYVSKVTRQANIIVFLGHSCLNSLMFTLCNVALFIQISSSKTYESCKSNSQIMIFGTVKCLHYSFILSINYFKVERINPLVSSDRRNNQIIYPDKYQYHQYGPSPGPWV